MKKMLKTMSLCLLFISPIMIGMQQGVAPISSSAQISTQPIAAPDQRFNPAATEELEELMKKSRYVIENGWTAIVRLLDNGANVNAQDIHGMSALMLAVMKNNIDMAQKFLGHDADANVQNIRGRTVLMWAAFNDSIPMVELLLGHGATINAKDKSGSTALMFANSIPMVELLLARGADINARDKNGETVIMMAVMNNNMEMAELLFDRGAVI